MQRTNSASTSRLVTLLVALVALAGSNVTRAIDSVTVPQGFEVSLYADDDLAHDVFALTIDAHDRVVVSGPGYVRMLLDDDHDGVADRFQTYADGPATGAQGMYFDGDDLFCTGDGGLLHYRDRDGDGRADGPAEVRMPLKTGAEHHAHCVQKGPDGWWYLLAGNMAGVDERNVTLATSPIRSPTAGVLMRVAPDFSGTEVVADGLRNAYDFAFHAWGGAFAFDSDGERDVSLPWYRPTRVFQLVAGGRAGWVSPGWKRPEYFPDMPPVIVDCGRGSPTGVVAYRHHRFPARYQHGLFLLDWTFGRVWLLPLEAADRSWPGKRRHFWPPPASSALLPRIWLSPATAI